jgi:hypothetical protein
VKGVISLTICNLTLFAFTLGPLPRVSCWGFPQLTSAPSPVIYSWAANLGFDSPAQVPFLVHWILVRCIRIIGTWGMCMYPNTILVSKAQLYQSILLATVLNVHRSISLLTLNIVSNFIFLSLGGCARASHCGFNMYFSD